jgi:DNA repair protein RecO (recombination protein O)
MDLEKISYASFILDLINQVLKQTEDSNIFDLLKDTLNKLEEGLNPIALTNILELKLLDYLGVSPSIDACAHCGSQKDIVTLSSDAGGYVCKNCYNNEPLVSDKTIKMIRMYYYVDIKNITKLDVSNEVTNEINRFLDDYYDRFTGLYIKSKDFLKKINSLNKE